MNTPDLDAIRARTNAATEGPWRTGSHPDLDFDEYVHAPDGRGLARFFRRTADVTFTAHARTDIPNLLAEVDRLRGANTYLTIRNEEVTEDLHNEWDFTAKVRAEVAALTADRDALAAEVEQLRGERDHWKSRWEFQLEQGDEQGLHVISLDVENRRLRIALNRVCPDQAHGGDGGACPGCGWTNPAYAITTAKASS